MSHSRQIAFTALRSVYQGAFADVAVDRALQSTDLSSQDRRLVTELVYGSVRRQRTLDALIDQLGKKKAHQQPPDLRVILHLGLYQLRYLSQIPAAAAVNTTVELAKRNGFPGLTGFVNGLMRQYTRLSTAKNTEATPSELAATQDPLSLPSDPVERLSILHSYPSWIVQVWLDQLGLDEAEQLCQWMNQPPSIDLRVNPLRASLDQVEAAMQAAGVAVQRLPYLPQALRLTEHVGSIKQLPGFEAGWWMIQDASAQLVGYLLDPQPGEMVVDACAAPGGKTIHIAELMQDQGTIWACDRTSSRLKKLQENAERLQIRSIQICLGDSRELTQFTNQCDRVLLDAPCSGLGTLHRHADARWRQTPENVQALAVLQQQLLTQVATWVKPNGVLVYSTCTLHPSENEAVVQSFLAQHPDWQIDPPQAGSPGAALATSEGWMKVWPHQQQMDGFFMVRLTRS